MEDKFRQSNNPNPFSSRNSNQLIIIKEIKRGKLIKKKVLGGEQFSGCVGALMSSSKNEKNLNSSDSTKPTGREDPRAV